MIEFAHTFGSDRSRDAEGRVVIIVATDYVNNSCLSSVAKRKRAQDEYVIGVGKAELKSDQEPSTMEHARHLAT